MTQPSAPRPLLSPARVLVICTGRVFLFATFMTVAATIPLISRDWDLSATQAGMLVSGFTLGYAASLFLFAWAADHFGAKRMVLLSAGAATLSSLAFGFFAQDWLSAFLLYGLAGLAQGGIYTPLIMVLSDEVPPARRGNAMGWLISSTSVGYATSLGAAGLGIALGGWQLAFILTGLLPSLGALLLVAALWPLGNRIHPRPATSSLGGELRRSRSLIAGYTAHSWELLGMWAWVPAFLAASLVLKGAEATQATAGGAYLSGAMHLFGAVAAMSMGWLSDRSGRRPVLIALAAGSALLSLSFGWLIALPMLILVPLAFVYAFLCLGDSPVLTVAVSESVRPGYLGRVLAWRALLGFGAGSIAPIAFGWALDLASGRSPEVAWGLAFMVLGLGGLIATACALPRLERRPLEETQA